MASDVELIACYLGLVSVGMRWKALSPAFHWGLYHRQESLCREGGGGGLTRQDTVKGRGFVLLSFSYINFLITC